MGIIGWLFLTQTWPDEDPNIREPSPIQSQSQKEEKQRKPKPFNSAEEVLNPTPVTITSHPAIEWQRVDCPVGGDIPTSRSVNGV